MGDFNDFVTGAVAMGYTVAGLFFLRFYFRTKDRLFIMFCVALWLLGAIRFGTVIWFDPMEHHFLYWLRFAAYLLILGAIVDKNLPRSSSRLEEGQFPRT